jgi:hypothetical protein
MDMARPKALTTIYTVLVTGTAEQAG